MNAIDAMRGRAVTNLLQGFARWTDGEGVYSEI